MLYDLVSSFIAQFRYITFRTSIGAFVAFLLVILFTPSMIKYLKRMHFKERVDKKDSDFLAEHHKGKKDVVTMGGFVMIGAIIITTALFARLDNIYIAYALLLVAGFAILGYLDDIIKLRSTKHKGISKSTKIAGQLILGLAVGLGLWHYFNQYPKIYPEANSLYIPLVKTTWNLGLFYPIFVALVITASSNAVNLTDGLDGLATGCLIMAGLAFLVITYIIGRIDYTNYLHLQYIPGCGELTIFMAAFVGACMGFLCFNGYPAQVFMGNVGSVALGGAMGFVAVVAKQELTLFLVGAIFVIDTLSVILQIISFRIWGKRIFQIAPLHHHFEKKGMHEAKITLRFWLGAAILAILTLATLKIEF